MSGYTAVLIDGPRAGDVVAVEHEGQPFKVIGHPPLGFPAAGEIDEQAMPASRWLPTYTYWPLMVGVTHKTGLYSCSPRTEETLAELVSMVTSIAAANNKMARLADGER